MINKDKLTPYDVQILNMVALSPGAWFLSFSSMGHQHFGDFVRSLWGFGLQQNATKSMTPHYRQLSWRGQILLAREHKRMLRQPVEDRPANPVSMAAGAMMGPPGPMGPQGMQGPQGISGLAGAALLGRALMPPPRPTLLGGLISATDMAEIQDAAVDQFRQASRDRLVIRLGGIDLAKPDPNGVVANKDTGS